MGTDDTTLETCINCSKNYSEGIARGKELERDRCAKIIESLMVHSVTVSTFELLEAITQTIRNPNSSVDI